MLDGGEALSAELRSVQGITISVSPTVIAHKGPVSITIANYGTAGVKPSNNDWIACYSPAISNITSTTPIRYQMANWTGTWGPSTPAKTTLTFNLNNLHSDYACYLFTGGLASVPLLPAALDVTYVNVNNPGQNTPVNAYSSKPFVSMIGSTAKFTVLAGPSSTISFDKPNLPTHVRTRPGKAPQSFNFVWNQVAENRAV